MTGYVWFGTRGSMQWVPAPAINVDMGKSGFSLRADFMNGGSWARRSRTSAKRFNFSWNLASRASLQPVLDLADWIYGGGFIYYSDPFAMDRNVLPSWCASPFLNGYDGPWLSDGLRPALQDNGTSTNGYPVESATYTLTAAAPTQEVFVPIPPGYTAFIGAHGEALSGDPLVTVTAYATAEGGPSTNLTLLTTSDALTNFNVDGDAYIGFSIKLGATTTGSLRLDGLFAQVLPTGSASPSGNFVSGQGTSGMSFAETPALTGYSSAMDLVGVTAELVETEAWTWQ